MEGAICVEQVAASGGYRRRKKIGQNGGVSGHGDHHRLRHENMLRVHANPFLAFLVCVFSTKSVETAVPEDGKPPGALVLTKLIDTVDEKIGQNGGLSGNGGHHRLRHTKMLRVHGFKLIFGVLL